MRFARTLIAVVSAAALLSGAGCAHQGAAEQAQAGTIPAKDTADQHEETLVITGSHLRQRLKDVCGGLPRGIDNVHVYCREQLGTTGHPGDTGGALQTLDPSVSTR